MVLKCLAVTGLLLVTDLSVVQGQGTRFSTYPVRSCHLADSMLGDDIDKTSGRIISVSSPDSTLRIFSTEPRPFMDGATGVVAIGGSLTFTGSTPHQLPPFQLDLKVISPRQRAIEDRQLSFILDDTVQVLAGSMTASLQHWPGVTDAVENMAIVLPFHRLTQLALARSPRGHLGQTSFSFTTRQLANLRSLLVAAICYVN